MFRTILPRLAILAAGLYFIPSAEAAEPVTGAMIKSTCSIVIRSTEIKHGDRLLVRDAAGHVRNVLSRTGDAYTACTMPEALACVRGTDSYYEAEACVAVRVAYGD